MCTNCDKRENCAEPISSACIDYTGKVSNLIKTKVTCAPNINDIIEEAYKILEQIKKSLGDNTTLDKQCLTYNSAIVTQKELNQEFTNKLCELDQAITDLGVILPIDAANIVMTINLLCVESSLCVPLTQYTLAQILQKFVLKICDHETRITAIETFLGL